MSNIAVAAEGLVRTYGDVTALKGIDLSVKEGELFGIIGPDGAGKTTLFRILVTVLLADSGTARVDGLDALKDYREIRRRVGYMPGKFSLYQDLTVEENLEFFATVFGTTIKENYDLIADIYRQIEPFKKRRAGALSGGMKQKLALSCALIHRPRVLFLDEPTTGVDPVSRKDFWDMLARLKETGLTILVSTPYMDEAARCDRIALIREGRFLQTDTPAAIRASYPGSLFAVKGENMYRLLGALRGIPGVRSAFPFGDSHHVSFGAETATGSATVEPATVEALTEDAVAAALAAAGHPDATVEKIGAGIEDCFLNLSLAAQSEGENS